MTLTLHDNYEMFALNSTKELNVADRVKLIERIAARGRRKLEKRDANIAKEKAHRELEQQKARDAEDAILAARDARRVERQARQLRAALRGPPTPEQILSKKARAAKRAERKAYRAFLAEERKKRNAVSQRIGVQRVTGPRRVLTDAEVQAKRDAEIAAVEAVFAKRRLREAAKAAKRLPPLPYSSVPPLPY